MCCKKFTWLSDVLIKSVAAKAHAVGLGKFTDDVIKDANRLDNIIWEAV